MGIRTGAEVIEGLRDGRQVFIDGEQVKDVTTDRRFVGGARTIAELYDMQHDPETADVMSYPSPATGAPVGLSFIQAASKDDLARRRVMVKHWHDHTFGMFGRAPDFINVMLAGYAAATETFGPYAENVQRYYEFARDGDLVSTHSLTNPQVDRSRDITEQEKDLAARAVKETDAGIVIRGARMLATLGVFSDELLVMPAPSYPLPETEEAKKFAIGFAIPVAAPGIRQICRPAVVHQQAGSTLDFPLSSKLDETDCMVVFDDVLVPWERVFIYRDVEVFNSLYRTTGAGLHMAHQFTTKDLAKAEFMMALAFTLVRTTRVDVHLHIQGMLAELINYTEVVRSCLMTSEALADAGPNGTVLPDHGPLDAVRFLYPQMFRRSCEIIQTIGAGGLFMVPSFAELSGPVANDVERYYQAAATGSRERIKLFRLAYDATLSSFSGRQQLYEKYFAGDLVRAAGFLYDRVDKEPHVERIWRILDELEAREAEELSRHGK